MADRPAIVSLIDPDSEVQQRITVFGNALVTWRRTLLDSRLGTDAVTAGRWTSGVTGSGSVVFGTTTVLVETGAVAGSTAFVQTALSASFTQSFENEFSGILRLTSPLVATNTLRWGVFDANNGFFFQISGGLVRIVTRKAGVDTVVTDLNGTKPFVVDALRRGYGIRYLQSFAQFVQGFDLVHSEPLSASALIGPLVETATLPLRVEVANGATAANTGVESDALTAQGWTTDIGAQQARVTSVARSAVVQTLLQQNIVREGFVIHNDSPGMLFVKYGAAASTIDFTVRLGSQDALTVDHPCYRGIVTGIWAAAGPGSARITELLP